MNGVTPTTCPFTLPKSIYIRTLVLKYFKCTVVGAENDAFYFKLSYWNIFNGNKVGFLHFILFAAIEMGMNIPRERSIFLLLSSLQT